MPTFRVIHHRRDYVREAIASAYGTQPRASGWYAVSEDGRVQLGPFDNQLAAGHAAHAYIIATAA